jgi:hypothetical protein
MEGGQSFKSVKIYGRIADLEQPSSLSVWAPGAVFFTIDAKEAIQNDDI